MAKDRSLQLSHQGCPRLVAPWGCGQLLTPWLLPFCSCPLPLGDMSLPLQDNVNFCCLTPGQPPTSPGLSAPLVSNLRGTTRSPEEEDEEEYDREESCHPQLPEPWPPPCPAAPTSGCWRWMEMETQWGEMEEMRSSKRTANLPPSAGTEPSSLPGSFHILPWDRASSGGPCPKGTRGCHLAVPGRDPARTGPAGGAVVRGRSVPLAQPQRAGAGEYGLLAGTRDSPGQGQAQHGWASSLLAWQGRW